MIGTPPTVGIVAAVIVDAAGHLLLVRKQGTQAFMQPGGKPEPGESDLQALRRELREELGCGCEVTVDDYLGCFRAAAANEPGAIVEARVYRVRLAQAPSPRAEIAELIWLAPARAPRPALAPLTEHHILPQVPGFDRGGSRQPKDQKGPVSPWRAKRRLTSDADRLRHGRST
jgi:8-oxo-dGTP diphosphatase